MIADIYFNVLKIFDWKYRITIYNTVILVRSVIMLKDIFSLSRRLKPYRFNFEPSFSDGTKCKCLCLISIAIIIAQISFETKQE